MKDFSEAFKVGLKAASDIGRVQAEVDKVFSELNSPISEASNGLIAVSRVGPAFSLELDKLMIGFSGVEEGSLKDTSGMIVLRSVNNSRGNISPVKVAEWSQSSTGFAFTIRFDRREIISKSVTQLRNALTELLASPVVGSAFLSLKEKLGEGEGPVSRKRAASASKPPASTPRQRPERAKATKAAKPKAPAKNPKPPEASH